MSVRATSRVLLLVTFGSVGCEAMIGIEETKKFAPSDASSATDGPT